tara:strand:- start:411 stop:746 length:336 start_codon:yes stop_codon:yes gene_type:complete
MTDPQYVTSLADIYTKMYNHPGEEKPLVVQEGVSDMEEVPRWKQLLRDAAKGEGRKGPPYAPHVEPQEDASEDEEQSTAELAMKYVLELIGEAEHDEAAANTLYMIRDLVK